MTIREFLSQLQEAHDSARARQLPSKEIVATFRAPSSGFCGPTVRPKYLGDASPTTGRYGLTCLQVEQMLEAFDVTLPAAA